MNKALDTLETMILMSLDANQKPTTNPIGTVTSGRHTISLVDVTRHINCDDMLPNSMYTYDMADEDRIVANHPDYLMEHPAEIIGDESEMLWIDPNGWMRWSGYRLVKKRPRGLAYLGKASHIYEVHHRVTNPSGKGEYNKRYVPLDKNGMPLVATIHGVSCCELDYEGSGLILAAGLVEDAHRSNAMLATIKEGKEIKFPVPLDDYKEVFFDREAPLVNGKKKAIVHWVAKHLRQTPNGKTTTVKKHVRGVKDIVVDGLTINIRPN